MKEQVYEIVMNAIKKVSKSEMEKNIALRNQTGRILRTVNDLKRVSKNGG